MSANINHQEQNFQTIPDDEDDSNGNNNLKLQPQSQIPHLPPIQPVIKVNSSSAVKNEKNNNDDQPVVVTNDSIIDSAAPSQEERIQVLPINSETASIVELPNSQSRQQQQQELQQVVSARTFESKVKPVLRSESSNNKHSHAHSTNNPYYHYHHHREHDRILYEPSYIYHSERPKNATRGRYRTNQDIILYDPRDRKLIYEERYERLPMRLESRSRNLSYDSNMPAFTQPFENPPKVIPYPVPVMINNPYMMPYPYPMSAYTSMLPNTQMPLINSSSQMPIQQHSQQTTTTETQSNPPFQQQTQQSLKASTKEQTTDEPKQSPRFIYNIHYSPATSKPKVIETNYQIIKRKKPKQSVAYR